MSKARGREDLISPELQRTAIEDYARRSGIVIVEWREALDESGSQDRSPWWATLDEVVAAVEAGERDVVVVWKYSRAARHRRRWAIAIDRIEVAGGQLESATEGLDTTTSTGRLGRGMLAEIAAWEAERIGEQWKEAQARRRSLGLPHSGAARFGYVYEKGKGYRKDAATAPILEQMYARYLAGEGHTGVARWLNRSGVPTVRGARTGWSVQAVIGLMDNGFAAGLVHIKSERQYLPGAHEAIIDPATWEAYRAARQARWDMPARVREPAYPLSGLVKCGLCRGAMVAASKRRDGDRYGAGYMYQCSTRGTTGTCRGCWVTRAQVEARVLEWLREEVVGDVEQRAAGRRARQSAAAELRVQTKATERERLRLEQARDRARGFLVDGTLTREEYEKERVRLDGLAAELDQRLAELRRDVGRLTGPAVTVARGLLEEWETLPVRARRDMLSGLVRRVVLTPGERGAQGVEVHPLWEPDPWEPGY